jgi:hypothetical protein
METRALEWKRSWNLAAPEAAFRVAKQILGFGNRMPADAARTFGGYAYLLIGVEPGAVAGVEIPDPATLNNAVRRYVAENRPSWEAEAIHVDDSDVFVIEVAPPQDGDRICCLMLGSGNAQPGRVFIRRPGVTSEAGPEEVRALEDRMLAVVSADARRAVDAHERLADSISTRTAREDRLLAAMSAEAQRAADVHERLAATISAQAAHEAEARARRRAPKFAASRSQPLFAFTQPHRMEGRLRNDGESRRRSPSRAFIGTARARPTARSARSIRAARASLRSRSASRTASIWASCSTTLSCRASPQNH